MKMWEYMNQGGTLFIGMLGLMGGIVYAWSVAWEIVLGLLLASMLASLWAWGADRKKHVTRQAVSEAVSDE